MSQSLSWIDPSTLEAALNRAGFSPTGPSPAGSGPWGAVAPAPQAAAPAAGPGPDTFGPTRGLPGITPIPPAPGTSSSKPAQAPTRPAIEISSALGAAARPTVTALERAAPPPLRLESNRLDLRLNSYLDWVEEAADCRGLFIVDEEGLVLMERESDPNLVALSAYFLNLKDRIPDSLGTRSEGSIAIDLDDDRVLHVIQADTRLGPHALGFTVESPLHRDLTQAFQEMLSTVFAQV